jgi:hypothetical protein
LGTEAHKATEGHAEIVAEPAIQTQMQWCV